jgi:FAD/FMN-containing dehydrogenase
MANSRNGEGFIAVSAEARKKFWLDRKRTAAISRHTNAFKINEDVVIPLPRMGEYTDGIERINIELSLRNKLQAVRRERLLQAGNLPLGKSDDAGDIPSAELLEDRVQQAWRCWPRCASSGRAGWTAAALFPLQDHRLRALEDPAQGAAVQDFRGGASFAALSPSTRSTRRCSRAVSGWRCTCTPATAMCTPTSRSTPTTTKCCRPRTKPWPASWSWRAAWTA